MPTADDVPGIGPIIASAMVATIGDGSAFRRGRDFAWLGLVPRQISNGRSNHPRPHLQAWEQLSSHTLRAGSSGGPPTADQLAQAQFRLWLEAAAKRMNHNVLAAALANKLTRIAWSVLYYGGGYEPRVSAELA